MGRNRFVSTLLPAVILSVAAVSGAHAFDSAAWFAKRADLTNEVARLQAAYRQCAQAVDSPAEDVALPIETHPDGSVKTSVQAKKAQYFLQSGLVWGEDVVVRTFKADGSPDLVLEAKNCVVDRLTKSAWAEGPARLTQGGTVFRGRGVYFSSPEGYVRVTQDADLESTDLKGLERGLRK